MVSRIVTSLIAPWAITTVILTYQTFSNPTITQQLELLKRVPSPGLQMRMLFQKLPAHLINILTPAQEEKNIPKPEHPLHTNLSQYLLIDTP